jgi:alanyl-tRNA synthetase
MGGQTFDTGELRFAGGVFEVRDVQKDKGGRYLHYGAVISGELPRAGEGVTASIDTERRRAVMRAHSSTHLLQKALRVVLGEHVNQAGSLVEPDRVRFDFSHFSALTADELTRVEEIVNDAILDGLNVGTEEMAIDRAREKGAMALFGEKYGDTVRVVVMGGADGKASRQTPASGGAAHMTASAEPVPGSGAAPVKITEIENGSAPEPFSIELCGGTHLDNTAKAGSFYIVGEYSVASGVRRIEAVTGKAAFSAHTHARARISSLAAAMKLGNPDEIEQRVAGFIREVRELRREADTYAAKEAEGEGARFLAGARDVGGIRTITAALPDANSGRLRQIGDLLRERGDNVAAVLASSEGGKLTFLAVCGKNAIARGIKAGELIKAVTSVCGGSGGGKPDSAMGGGRDVTKLDNALAVVDDFIIEKLR